MGWIGSGSQMEYYLRVVGADRDDNGRFKVRGCVASFLGAGEEVVIGDDAEYFVNGRASNLVVGLSSTSYGVRVVVIA